MADVHIWHEWKAGPDPVSPLTIVECELHNGEKHVGYGKDCNWQAPPTVWAIARYRVVEVPNVR